MRALVLGAGASAAYSQSPTGLRMPVARNFFQAVTSLPQSEHPWVMLHGLFTYLEDYRGVEPVPYLYSPIDIEELHSEVYEAALTSLREHGMNLDLMHLFKAHHELVFLFAYTLNLIQNGPTSLVHQRLASLLRPDDGVITFNWDTLMDRALVEKTAWRPDSGYGVRPKAVFRDGWQPPSDVRSTPLTIWKLHGSTNWLTSHEQVDGKDVILIQEAGPDTLNVFESATAPYSCYAGRFMDGFGPFSYGYYPPNLADKGKRVKEGYVITMVRPKYPWSPEGTADSNGLISMPLIIPPVKDKAYDRFGDLFQRLWAGAQSLLTAADQIVVIGYSFPRTDHRSLQLFRDAFMRRATIPDVVVIDPAPERAVGILTSELGVPANKLTVHAAWLDSESEIERVINA